MLFLFKSIKNIKYLFWKLNILYIWERRNRGIINKHLKRISTLDKQNKTFLFCSRPINQVAGKRSGMKIMELLNGRSSDTALSSLFYRKMKYVGYCFSQMMEPEHKCATTSVLNNVFHCFDICGQRPLNFQDGEKHHGSGAASSR